MSYDTPYTHPVHEARPIHGVFGVGLVLTGNKTDRSLAAMEISISRNNGASTPIANTQLESMRLGIPAARSLPLLAALADRKQTQVCINYVAGNQVHIVVQPC
jgi:hypothetical protein